MYFLPDQAVEYDKKRQQIPQVREMELFVSDERSAIDWLTNFLKRKPSTYAEIHPEYIPVVGAAKKKGEVIPELAQLLDDNFIQYDGRGDVPSQIHSLLSTNFKDLRGLEKNDPRLMAKAKAMSSQRGRRSVAPGSRCGCRCSHRLRSPSSSRDPRTAESPRALGRRSPAAGAPSRTGRTRRVRSPRQRPSSTSRAA